MPTRSDVRPTSHDRHDPLLVAALAAGDLAATDRVHATELIRTCTDCATLHDDLVAIARATATVPPPITTRPRDFRLSPEQAARLRPSGWRRLVGAFAGPRLAFTRPLGIGLTTIGLAGLLLSNVSLGFLGGSASTAGPAPYGASSGAGGVTPESQTDGRGSAIGAGGDTAAEPAASAAPAASAPAASAYAAALPSAPASSTLPRAAEGAPSAQITGSNDGVGAAGGPKTSSPNPALRDNVGASGQVTGPNADTDLRTLIFVAAVLMGLGLLVARRVARRVTIA
jgi:hypothetical protein